MKKISVLIVLCFVSTIFLALPALAGPISKSVILQKVMDGSARMESRIIGYAMESMDKDTLAKFANRQKLANPKFELDNLYYKFTYDDQYEYQFYYNFVHNVCSYGVQKRDAVKAGKLCYNDINNCLGKSGGADKPEDVMACRNKSTNCSQITEKPSSETIDKKYCDQIYGRSL